MGLKDILTGFKIVRGQEEIHLNFVQAPESQFNAGHEIKMAILDQQYTGDIMAGGKVGYSDPHPIFFAETPHSKIITGTPEIKQTASINVGGGCK
jgi:hypothetical protein